MLCVELDVFVAVADACEPLDWFTEPQLSAATFGEAFTEIAVALASCETLFDASCD